MTLRDLRLTADFKRANYDLHQSLLNHTSETPKTPATRQQIGEYLAKAIGARDLGSYLSIANTTPAAPAEATTDPMIRAILAKVSVIVAGKKLYDEASGYFSLLDVEDTPLYSAQTLIDEASEIAATLSRCETFEPSARLTTLDLALPDFLDDLHCDAKQLEVKYIQRMTDTGAWSEYRLLGLTQKAWQDEVEQGNVLSGYWQWVVDQLEQWLFELQ